MDLIISLSNLMLADLEKLMIIIDLIQDINLLAVIPDCYKAHKSRKNITQEAPQSEEMSGN